MCVGIGLLSISFYKQQAWHKATPQVIIKMLLLDFHKLFLFIGDDSVDILDSLLNSLLSVFEFLL